MSRLTKPIWTWLPGYFISTNDTFDHGLETMVFPAKEGAGERETLYGVRAHGVDFGHPYEEYTRHYATVMLAREGHKETVALVKERIKHENA